jgi:hypothetical protein
VNPARKQILFDIEAELRDYGRQTSASEPHKAALMTETDELVERNNKMLSYHVPKRRDVRNVKTWIENSANLATNETEYLSKPDLLSVGTPRDEPLAQVELCLEKLIMLTYGIFKKVPNCPFPPTPRELHFLLETSSALQIRMSQLKSINTAS